MSRSSRTPFVILGLLSHEPMTGYDLKATIERTVGHFWQESYGQLYPALAQLHQQGLVSLDEEVVGARVRKVYAITSAGREALFVWLAEPAEPALVRSELLLKVFLSSLGEEADLRPHLLAAGAGARARAAALRGIRAAVQAETATEHERRCWLLTVDLGVRHAEATLAWAEEALSQLGENR